MTPCTCTPLLHVRTPSMSYTPVVINGWFWSKLKVVSLRCLSGFTDKEFDDVKGIFLDTSAWLFGLTIFISVFHVSKSHGRFHLILNSLSLSLFLSLISFTQLLFDFLAFKNDISFWRQRKTMVGLSSRVSKLFIKECGSPVHACHSVYWGGEGNNMVLFTFPSHLEVLQLHGCVPLPTGWAD